MLNVEVGAFGCWCCALWLGAEVEQLLCPNGPSTLIYETGSWIIGISSCTQPDLIELSTFVHVHVTMAGGLKSVAASAQVKRCMMHVLRGVRIIRVLEKGLH